MMTRNLYKLQVSALSLTILLIIVFVLSRSVLGITQDDALKLEGLWKQVGYGRVVEVKKGKIKIYDISKVSCLLVAEDETGNEDIKEITKNRVVMREGISEMEFRRIKSLPKLCSQNTDREKDPLFNFDSLWHTFNENYAYFKTRNIDWDAYYQKYRSRLSSKSTDEELYVVIKEMLDSIGDGHINFNAPKNLRKDYAEKQKKAGKEEMSSTEIFLISQKLTDQIAKKYAKNIKTYNSGVLRWGMIEGDIAYLQINFMFLMSKQDIPENASFLEFIQKYLQIVEESNEQHKAEVKGAKDAMKTILEDAKDARAFIIDLRFNPGGTDGVPMAFLSHFTDSRRKVFTKKARLGNVFTKGQELFIDSSRPLFKRDVYLLTSHQTASAAEIIPISSMAYPNITRIGSNTEGNFSDVLGKRLPNGWEYSLSNEVYQDVNGVDYESKGIPPHHEVKYSKDPKAFFEQISADLEKGDLAIEAALRLIKGDTSSIPVGHKNPDYTGVWDLDMEKSKLDELSRLEGATMIIDQTEKNITIKEKTKLKEGGGNSLSLSTKDKNGEKCSFDGSEVVREIEHSMATGSITLKCGFRGDGKLQITKNSLIFVQGQSINASLVDVWDISKDGKTLTIDSKNENHSRTVENKMVFIRKDNLLSKK